MPVITGFVDFSISALINSLITTSGVVLFAAALMRSQSAERLSTKTTCPECFAKKPLFPLPDTFGVCFVLCQTKNKFMRSFAFIGVHADLGVLA